MRREKSVKTMVKLEKSITIGKLLKFSFVVIITAVLFISGTNVSGQTTSQAKLSDNTADRNLKSVARVNPSTLAMEFSVPFMNYPGRSGNSLAVGFSYSSKIWRMYDKFNNYSYQLPYSCNRQYVTQLYPKFADRNTSGWSSNLAPPIIEEKVQAFNAVGNPHTSEFDDDALNNLFQELIRNYEELMLISSSINGPPPCGWYCADVCIPGSPQGCNGGLCEDWQYNHCSDNPVPGSCGGTTPQPTDIYTVKRVNIRTSDGATHEFRQSDAKIVCGTTQTPCTYDKTGTYLSVDGSGMRLERQSDGSTLFMPNGSKYKFPADYQHLSTDRYRYYYATEYNDSNGNTINFSEDSIDGQFFVKKTDTLGREIVDPLPQNFGFSPQQIQSKSVSLPGFDTNTQNYGLVWKKLKPVGCEESTLSSCGNGDGTLEDQTQRLYFDAAQTCLGATYIPIDDNNPNANEYLFPTNGWGLRSCSSLRVEQGGNVTAHRFNPTVLAEISLPNGTKYEFKYNQWGEITKIIYPTGAYEKFEYGQIQGVDGFVDPAYNQTNRGVKKHWIYDSSNVLQQKWQFDINYDVNSGKYTLTTTGSKGDDAEQPGMKTERQLHYRANGGANFGFGNPLVGMPIEETTKDENGVIRARTLSKWTYTGAVPTGDPNNPAWGIAKRDARPLASISVTIEGDKALAVMSENIYQNPDTDSGVPSDPSYFARLNVKQTKSYHYRAIDINLARYGTFDQLDDYFLNETPASIGETTYQYDANYKERGIASLPIESRVINPNDPNPITKVLSKTQTIFDNQGSTTTQGYTSTENYDVSTATDSTFNCSNISPPKICWQNPDSIYLGRATTSRVWNKDTDTWIESHTKYDIFGNAVKAMDPIGNEASTTFTKTNEYAYPEQVITSAPDPTNTTGTSQESKASTTYDFMTGLPKETTAYNDLTTPLDDKTTATEYNDALLRPTRSYAVNFPAPEAQTIYDDTPAVLMVGGVNVGDGDPISVKVRKQIDATNWDEAETFADSMGRTYLTQAKDSQGDVFVETEYDLLGRIKRTSNPYRLADVQTDGTGKFWTNPRYDALGRVYESCVAVSNAQSNPEAACPTGTSTGITSFAISDEPNFVGTVVTSTDASGRKSRSITNALGQLLRIDEATATGGTEAVDLGSLGSPHQPTYYNYSPQGQMVKVQQGKAGETIQYRYFKYDSLGRLIRVRQPEQEVNANLNLTDSITNNNQWTAGFTYDVVGNLRRSTDAEGVNIVNEYDKASRIIRRCYTKPNIQTSATQCFQLQVSELSETTPYVSYFYDGFMEQSQPPTASPNYAKGKLTRVYSSVSETKYTQFDELGRLTQSQQITNGETYTSGYQYNFAGALVKEIYPSGREVKNEFEADGDLSRIYGKASSNATERTYANSFSYTADGRIEKLKLGNGLWESAKFNNRLQVTEFNLGIGVNDASKWKLQYQYGELQSDGTTVDTNKNTGNIAKQISSFAGLANPFVQTFKYDSLYRLKEAKETVSTTTTWKQNFDYDRFGNRITFIDEIGGQVQTNTNLRHPSINANTNRFNDNQGYLYDKNGNLTNDPTNSNRTFIFNGENKQTEVKDANGNSIGKYFYDGEGKRVKKEVYANGQLTEITVFVYSNGKLVAEYSTAPPPQNPTTNYTMTDQLDSPRVITNALGEVTNRRDFKPFGEEITPETAYRTAARKYGVSDNIRQKFTGYQKDNETQLDFAEARMYQNLHGRFTAVDPLLASGKSANPQTFNRFVYVMNNPLIFTDPSGLQASSEPPVKDVQGQIYTDGNENYSNVQDDVYNTPVSEGFSGTVISKGYLYHIIGGEKGGWQNLGNAEDIISDWDSMKIGWRNMANGIFTFNAPICGDPNSCGSPYALRGPSFYDITGWKPFSDEETQTLTFRDNVIATVTQIGTEAVIAAAVTKSFNSSSFQRGIVNTTTRGFAYGTRIFSPRSNGAVSFAADFSTMRFSFARSGMPAVPKGSVNSSMNPLIQEAKANGVTGLGGPRTCCEFKAVNNLLNRGSKREDIIFQVIDVRTLRPLGRCNWCRFTTRGATALNGNQ